MPPKKTLFDDFEEPVARPPANPLAKYFRIPGIHVRLPTQGRFMPPGAVELTETGEVPVLPMRAADEILLKSPDALLNGYALEKLIESCVPAVKDVRSLASPDLDVLLLAIRAATFGPKMTVEATCPKCEYANEFDALDIGAMLDNVQELDADNSVQLSPEVVVFVRPYTFANATQASLAAFSEAKRMKTLENATEDERTAAFNEGIDRLNKLNLALTSDCVLGVVTPDGEVTNRQQINEFIEQMPANWYNQIDARLKAMNKQSIDKSQHVKCIKCEHEWTTEVEFDPTSFFEHGS